MKSLKMRIIANTDSIVTVVTLYHGKFMIN